MDVTEGHLLGRRVRYDQPHEGFRTGIEPVLLAAAIPARAGDRVLEGGSGAGAGLLCLAARVPGVLGLGLERDPGLVRLAGENARINGFAEISFAATDLGTFRAAETFDHAFANPPYHLETGTRSPEPGRDSAKHAGMDTFSLWTKALAAALRPRGTLALILPAAHLAAAMAALAAARCGSIRMLPLWPRAGVAAKLVILQGVVGGRGPCVLGAGLILHREDGGYTDAAEEVLRHGKALPS